MLPSIVDYYPDNLANSTDGYLECTAVGIPQPMVAWFKEEALLTNEDFPISTSTDALSIFYSSSRLHINDSDSVDSGNYSCVASNGLSRVARHLFELEVIG